MEKLFVYGTLQNTDIQLRLVGRTITGVPDTLRGFRSHILMHYPTALPDAAGEISGQVMDVTLDEIVAFDAYETSAYLRVRVLLESGIEAWMYQGNPAVFGALLQDT
jgi:gamma-glutamylcyclotransferase (GGCT)/AIG2-like uncharacterized protein YtfP